MQVSFKPVILAIEPAKVYHFQSIHCTRAYNQFSSVHLFSCVLLFATPWTTACQASLSITNSWSLLKFTSIESVTPSNHLILCHPLLLLPSTFPSIRVFSNESVLHIRWPSIGVSALTSALTPSIGVSALTSTLPMNIKD